MESEFADVDLANCSLDDIDLDLSDDDGCSSNHTSDVNLLVEVDLVVDLMIEVDLVVDLMMDVDSSELDLDLWELEVVSDDLSNLDRSDNNDACNVLHWSYMELECNSSDASLDVDSLKINSDLVNLVLDLNDDSSWNVLDDST